MIHRLILADAKPKKVRFLSLLPWLILLSGLLLNLAYWQHLHLKSAQNQQAEFNLVFDRLLRNTENQLKANEQVLWGVAGLFQAQIAVTRSEFRTYIQALNIQTLYPGIQGIGFAKLLHPAELADHIQAIRNEGFADYQITPAGLRDPMSSIIYLEPFDWRNQRAFGYDMYADPVRREAMQMARQQKTAALSNKVILVQETEQDVQAGVLLYVPIFLPTAQAEQATFIGWAYSPLRMQNMMLQVLTKEPGELFDQLAIKIYDGLTPNPENLLFQAGEAQPDSTTAIQGIRQLKWAGQTWTLTASSLPGFTSTEEEPTLLIFTAGMLVSLLLTLLVRALVSNHIQTLETAALFRQYKAIVDSSGDAIFCRTLDDIIVSWNRRAEEIFGYSADEMLGQSMQVLLPSEQRLYELQLLSRLAQGEIIEQFETIGVHKSGRRLNISATISPIVDANGKPMGISNIVRDITERKTAERQLRDSENRLALATIHNGVGIWDWNLQSMEMVWDDSMFALYHMRREDFSGAVDAWEKSLHPDDKALGDAAVRSALSGEKPFDIEFRVVWPNGEIHWIKAVAVVFRDPVGRPLRMLGTNIDITDRKCAEIVQQLNEYRARSLLSLSLNAKTLSESALLQAVLAHAQHMTNSPLGYVYYVNQTQSALNLAAWSKDTLNIGQAVCGYELPLAYAGFWADCLQTRQPVVHNQLPDNTTELGLLHSPTALSRHISVPVLNAQQQILIILGIANKPEPYHDDDVRELQLATTTAWTLIERKRAEAEINHLAFFDPLTKLPNRRMLIDRLKQAMAASKRNDHYGAVMFMDLDNFKPLNDQFGHDAGDELLIEVARRITDCIREVDTVARFGGDEFVVVLGDLHTERDASIALAGSIAEKIRHSLFQPYHLPQPDQPANQPTIEHRCSATIGVVMFLGHQADPEQLLKLADTSMYIAKASGRNVVRFH